MLPQGSDWDDTRLILDLVCGQRLDSAALLTHAFPVDRAAKAYEAICSSQDAIGVVLDWRDGQA